MQTKVDFFSHDVKIVVDNTTLWAQLKDVAFSQKKLETRVQKLEEKLGVVDQKSNILMSFFLNQKGTDVKMGEKILKTKCSPSLNVHKDKDTEGGDESKKDDLWWWLDNIYAFYA